MTTVKFQEKTFNPFSAIVHLSTTEGKKVGLLSSDSAKVVLPDLMWKVFCETGILIPAHSQKEFKDQVRVYMPSSSEEGFQENYPIFLRAFFEFYLPRKKELQVEIVNE